MRVNGAKFLLVNYNNDMIINLFMDWKILQIKEYLAPVVDATKQLDPQDCYLPATEIFLSNEWWCKM